MKKLTLNFLTLIALICIAILYSEHSSEELNYWNLLKHHLVLNVGLASVALFAGFWVKNYLLIFLGSSFTLIVFSLTLIFSPGSDFLMQFFLAIYTVFLAFSVIANLCRHFRDWLLPEKIYA